MKRTRHTPVAAGFSEGVQIIRKLKTADQLIAQGKRVSDFCRVLEVAQPTYHRWRRADSKSVTGILACAVSMG